MTDNQNPGTSSNSNDKPVRKNKLGPRMDIRKALTTPPPPLDFVFWGFLVGTVGALIAPGSAGKTFWALLAAIAVACGVKEGDVLGLRPSKAGKVLFISLEDREELIWSRLFEIAQHLGPGVFEMLEENLEVISCVGEGLNIMDDEDLAELIERGEGCRLMVVDTISRLHTLEESSNADMVKVIGRIEKFCARTGAAGLYLHHASKESSRAGNGDQQESARGASALIDNARWAAFIQKMTKGESELWIDPMLDEYEAIKDHRVSYIKFGETKVNYGPPTLPVWGKKVKGGVIVPVELIEMPQDKKGGANSTPMNKAQKAPSGKPRKLKGA